MPVGNLLVEQALRDADQNLFFPVGKFFTLRIGMTMGSVRAGRSGDSSIRTRGTSTSSSMQVW